jgi:hypothetical protein
MTTYAKRKLKYSRNENFNLLHYVEWDRIVTLVGTKANSVLQQTEVGYFLVGTGPFHEQVPMQWTGGPRQVID